ncbi:MAG: SRPBCC domain-containing protein [Prosthecobacter sp.]|jgi:uncharacterized protein YndB with AHSA1/START domain|uniref:SRPBCC family protein n=1 Tax=Prosthecobacter sp. TaxID=1965333 RepID=UPI001A08D41D|nr:SRPBCC domain-containing protein [Prosthecobacter sp.]MBE2287057.1 SRPBCC domain-containing protein [Prosthecobacter sp.]
MPQPSATTIQISQLFETSRAQLFDAWTDLNLLNQWWEPDGFVTQEFEWDVRRGGMLLWATTPARNITLTARGKFREVRPDEKLVFSWYWADDPGWKDVVSVVTVEFRAKEPGITELRLTHSDLPDARSRDNHDAAWNNAFDRLRRLFDRLPRSQDRKTKPQEKRLVYY